MNAYVLVQLVGGFLVLVGGAELLVRGASRLAAGLGISPLVIGLTVVAFGTSAPEVGVSLAAALRGQGDLAFGNVIGSNTANVLLILGASALITPLVVHWRIIQRDVPVMIAASAAVVLMGLDGRIGRVDGLLLLAGLVVLVVYTLRGARSESTAPPPTAQTTAGRGRMSWKEPLLIVVGLGLLVGGSQLLVEGATTLARALGVSELVVGLTLVAVGTSLPELATSILAAIRGERDIAVGNVVGSNLFNILGVLGISALIASEGVAAAPAAMRFDVPVMVAAAVACLPIFFSGHLITRWEGLLLVAHYAAYILYLVLRAAEHPSLPAYSVAMLAFVLPLAAITVIAVAVQYARRRLW